MQHSLMFKVGKGKGYYFYDNDNSNRVGLFPKYEVAVFTANIMGITIGDWYGEDNTRFSNGSFDEADFSEGINYYTTVPADTK